MSLDNKREQFFSLFFNKQNHSFSLMDYLNNSSYDESVEIDLNKGTFKQFYHVDGKYFVPSITGTTYQSLFEFARDFIVHPDDKEIFIDLMDPNGMLEKLAKSKFPNFRYIHIRYKLQNGGWRWVEQCLVTGRENGILEGMAKFFIFDFHHSKNREIGETSCEFNFLSDDKDKVTGLLKGDQFFKEASYVVDNEPETKWCLLSIDIEHFKLFDEWYGRETGDFLLAKVGSIIAAAENKYHGVGGYFNQDDFCFLTPYNMKNIISLFEEIRDLIIESGFSFGFLPAVGVAIFEKGLEITDVFDRASIAASKAKEDIRKRIYVYDPEFHMVMEHEYMILSDFMQALKKDEITFYLQPQCRISTGKIVGAESLARWIKEDGTIVPPNDFIPILEKYGFIADLDQCLWEKVFIWLRKWIDEGHKPVPISLNVSRADIFTIDVSNKFVELSNKYNVPRELIKLEITEGAYTETTSLIGDLVKKLREEGFLVLMDDFGSGYSSLNMLSNLKVDAIKLDANFLRLEGEEYEKSLHILESVINMAKQIAVPIIIEGVETKEQSDFLENMGCRYVQGYFFYRPMPVKDFENIIIDENRIDSRGFVVKLTEQFRIREFLDQNVYSDSMLNNIIGPVALYDYHDGHVDIVRFNQQFYEAVDTPDFHEKLIDIQELTPLEDKQKLIDLLEIAKKDRLNGSYGIIRFYKLNGNLTAFACKFYYIGVKEGSDRFYGSVSNITEFVDNKQQLQMIREYCSDTIAFLTHLDGVWNVKLAGYSLEEVLGYSFEEFESLLNSRHIYEIMPKVESIILKDKVDKIENGELVSDVIVPVSIYSKNNDLVRLVFDFDSVKDQTNNIEFVLLISLYKD